MALARDERDVPLEAETHVSLLSLPRSAATLAWGEVDGPFDAGHGHAWTPDPKSDMRPKPAQAAHAAADLLD
jgi:hypothetical protein